MFKLMIIVSGYYEANEIYAKSRRPFCCFWCNSARNDLPWRLKSSKCVSDYHRNGLTGIKRSLLWRIVVSNRWLSPPVEREWESWAQFITSATNEPIKSTFVCSEFHWLKNRSRVSFWLFEFKGVFGLNPKIVDIFSLESEISINLNFRNTNKKKKKKCSLNYEF